MPSLLSRISRSASHHTSTTTSRTSLHLPNPLTPSALNHEPSWWSTTTTTSTPPTPTPPQTTTETDHNITTSTITSISSTSSRYLELRLRAHNLINKDILSLSDPYALLALKRKGDGGEKLVEVGRTETVWDDLNPQWAESFLVHELDVVGGSELMVEIFDRDDDGEDEGKMDFLGRGVVGLGGLEEIGGRLVGRCELVGKDGKKGRERGDVVVMGEWVDEGLLGAQGGGKVVVDVRSWVVRRRGRVGVTQFWQVEREVKGAGGREWSVVFRSENSKRGDVVEGYHSWDKATLSRRELCNGDDDRRLRIVFFKRSIRGTHKMISFVETSLNGLRELYKTNLVASMPLEPDESAGLGTVTITSLKEAAGEKRADGKTINTTEITLRADHCKSAGFSIVPEDSKNKKSGAADKIGRFSDRLMKHVSMH